MNVDSLLVFVVMPLWVAAGLGDWWCHRRTRIEHSTGMPENLLHWVMFGLTAVFGVLVLAFESSGAVLSLLLGIFVLHETIVWFELQFVYGERPITPLEQMLHSVLEILPLVVIAALAADLAFDRQSANMWSFQFREDLPLAQVIAGLALICIFNVAPLIEETVRCHRSA